MTDSGSDGPGLSESDTDSVACLSPSESPYDANSENDVLCVVSVPPIVGSRPLYNHEQEATAQHPGQRGQRILAAPDH